MCPPNITNSVQNNDPMNTSIECKEGYWTIEKKSIQTINCTDTNWKSTVLPCIGRFIIHLGLFVVCCFLLCILLPI